MTLAMSKNRTIKLFNIFLVDAFLDAKIKNQNQRILSMRYNLIKGSQ